MSLKKLLIFCLELLFPPRCIFCGKIVAPGTKICAGCAGEIAPINSVRCMKPPGKGKAMKCAVLYSYQDRVRQSIIRFKFYGEKAYAEFYADRLAELVRKRLDPSGFDLVTAVPISEKRKKLRGFNQSELLARPLARKLGLPYGECLLKIRDNPEQHRLSREERLQNVRGMYRALRPQTQGKRILLVDDIVTTGSTLLECAGTLYSGGAEAVACTAVAQVGKEHG